MKRDPETRKKNARNAAPGPEQLGALCRHHGVKLSLEQVDQLWSFHTLLRARNRELNMTRIHNFESMVVKHYVDSMMVAEMIDLPSPLLDIGTGAGFPSIPLKIARPDLKIIMAEGRKKRVAFLEEAVKHLGLEGIEIYGRKIEPGFDRPVAGVITRALETAADTLSRVKNFLPPGGRVILMKGPGCEDEVIAARRKFSGSFDLIKDAGYALPHTPHRRRLLVFKRTKVEARTDRQDFHGRKRSCSSATNPSFLLFKKLLQGRGIRKTGQAILSGRRLVEETFRDHPRFCAGWITGMDDAPPPGDHPDNFTWYRLEPNLFREIDLFGTGPPLLLVDLPDIPFWTPTSDWPEGCTLLIPFQDPENVGSVIRSAAAFGVSSVVLLEEAANPFLPKACRAAGGSLFKVPLYAGPSINRLDLKDPRLFALSMTGTDLRKFRFPKTFGLLAGLEGMGLPEDIRKNGALAIPMKPGFDSLNAAAAVSVALYAWRC